MIKTNPIVSADAYTVSSYDFESPEAILRSTYNMTYRKSPAEAWPDVAKDSRIVVYGIKHYLDNYFNTQITLEHLAKAQAFMKRAHSFGGPMPFNYNQWYELITKHDGRLENVLNISSVSDGMVIFPNMPFIHVENRINGFGNIAAHVEARMLGMVSIASGVATLCRHWFERIKEEVRKDLTTLGNPFTETDVEKTARFFIHNFGSRACSTELESIFTGMAHLLTFNGTDNFDAAYQAWEEGAEDGIGTSIIALAHRNVQSWEEEGMCFEAVANATRGDKFRIASLVSDCYNFNRAVDKIIDMAKVDTDMCFVSRPDSGDVFTCLSTIYNKCKENGCTTVVNGFHLPKNVRWIEGDSIKPKVMWETFDKLRAVGCLPTLWGIFGIGGYIRNSCTRDSLSAKYALCRCGQYDRPVVKLSEDDGKLTIPGYNYITRDYKVIPINDSSVQSHLNSNNPFFLARQLCDKTWNKTALQADAYPNYGMDRSHLDKSIRSIQDSYSKKYKGE